MTSRKTWGLLAEFASPEEILAAARACFQEGYRLTDAFTPFPVEGLSEELGFSGSRIPLVVLLCGIAGGIGGYLLQYYCAAVAYPLNVGGRPFNSFPAFLPITFETTILAAAFGAVLGMFLLNGLPLPYHPLFNVERFALASKDRFFLCVEARDEKFDLEKTRRFLESLSPRGLYEIPA